MAPSSRARSTAVMEQNSHLLRATVAKRHPAIDYELRPRDEAALVGQEKQRRVGDILRLLRTAKWHLGFKHRASLLGAQVPFSSDPIDNSVHHFRADNSRVQGIAAYAIASFRAVHGNRARDMGERRLAGAIGHQERGRYQRGD